MELEHHLAKIFDAVPECIKLVSCKGALLEMTPAGLDMLEAESLEQAQTQLLVDYIKPEYRAAFHDLHKKVFQGQSGTLEFEIIGLKGGCRWVETKAVPLRDEVGNVVKLLGATRDISAHKQDEQEHSLLAAAVECTNDAIITMAPDTLISSWNHAAERLFGYTEAETVGQSILFLIPKALRKKERQLFDKLIRRKKVGHQYETRRKTKNGKLVEVSVTASPIKNRRGRIIGISNIIRDITRQKQNEQDELGVRQHLENKVASATENLKKSSAQSAEINDALNILLKQRETYKSEAQTVLSNEIESTILPFLKKLKAVSGNKDQSTQLLDTLESNLQHLLQSHENTNLVSVYHQLTPVENHVASMVRQGLTTKDIADTLKVSKETVNVHRKHIRKKLGLDSKAINLHSYLMSLNE